MRDKFSKKRIFTVIGVIASIFIVCFWKEWLLVNPFASYTFSDVSYASRDSEGNTYVVCDSGSEILKLSSDGKLLWKTGSSEEGFLSAGRVVADSEGNIYVYDVRIAQGIQIASEQIVKLSPDGRFDSVMALVDDRAGTVRQSIVGLVPKESGAVYMVKDEEGIVLCDLEEEGSVSYPLNAAESTVLNSAYNSEDEVLYYVTYDGKIYQYSDGKNDRLLYDSDSAEGSIPQEISYSDGFLYCADIGLRDTIQISCEDGDIGRIEVLEAFDKREIAYYVNASGGLTAATSYSVILWEGDTYEQLWDAPLSAGAAFLCCLVWLALTVICIAAALCIIKAVICLIRRCSFYAKITMAIIAGIACIVALFIGILLPSFQDMLLDGIYSRGKLAATAVTNSLPVESFENLKKPSDFMSEDYQKVRQAVRDVFVSKDDSTNDLYCVLYTVDDGMVKLVYTMEDICVVYPYDWEYEGTDMQRVMEEGATVTYSTSTSSGNFVFVHSPIYDDDGDVIGIIEVGTDLQSVKEKGTGIQMTLIVNLLAVTAAFFMLVYEIIFFVRGRNELSKRKLSENDNGLPVEIFRFIVFLIFFFTNLTSAILPIYAVNISEDMSSQLISPVMLAALPISAEVVSGAVFSAVGGKVINGLGAKKSIMISSVLFTAGLGIRVIPNIWLLTLSSLLIGAGWGILLLLVNIMIVELPDEEKDRGYAYYSVSAVSGANCAVVFGGFLVQWMSYTAVFAITAALSVILFFVCRRYMSRYTSGNNEATGEAQETHMSMLRFILRPRVIGFFVLMLTPLLICGYFLNYMFPIIGSQWGLSETYIGYAYILNGIVVLMLGTGLTEFFSNRNLKQVGLAISALLYAAAFLEVAIFANIPSLLVALVLIGVADSFGVPLLTGYFTDIKDVERYGYDRGFGVYSLFENGAQSLGSFVFGYVLLLGVRKGLTLMMIIISVFAIAFLISNKLEARREKMEETARYVEKTKD